MQSEQINELAAALAIAQGSIKIAEEDKTNYYKGKYASFESLKKATQKPLSENGLCIVHLLSMSDKGQILITQISHKSGQWMRSEVLLPVGTVGKGESTHELGKSITYCKRYSYAALLSMSTGEEDEDENVGSAVTSQKTPASSPADVSDLDKIHNEMKGMENFKGMLKYYKVGHLKEIPEEKLQEALRAIEGMRKG